VTAPDASADPDDLPEPDDIPPVSAEQLVDGHEGHPGESPPRRYPSTIGGMVYLVVLAVALAGLGLVAAGSWRSGVRVVGGALIAAAVARSLLSNDDAGMLAVRHRAVDVLTLTVLGVALLALASSIPNQPG
jgi:Protein of unknown function (DUF3017)